MDLDGRKWTHLRPGLVHLECFIYNIRYFGDPFAFYVHLLVMLLYCLHIGSGQETKAHTGFFVIKQIYVTDPELIWRGFAELSQIIFSKWHFVNIQEYRHQRYRESSN